MLRLLTQACRPGHRNKWGSENVQDSTMPPRIVDPNTYITCFHKAWQSMAVVLKGSEEMSGFNFIHQTD